MKVGVVGVLERGRKSVLRKKHKCEDEALKRIRKELETIKKEKRQADVEQNRFRVLKNRVEKLRKRIRKRVMREKIGALVACKGKESKQYWN